MDDPTAAALPRSLVPLLDAYLASIAPFGPRVVGVYLSGSLALGAFEEGVGDVDVVIATEGPWTVCERAALGRLHAGLNRSHPIARRLDALDVPLPDLGGGGGAAAHSPVARDGRFRPAGRGDVNAVTRWNPKHRSTPLRGPAGADLPFAVR